MKPEYEFSQGNQDTVAPTPLGKTLITIGLDDYILEWLRNQVHEADNGNYQTLIDKALREHIQHHLDWSEVEKKTNEELAFVFDLLARIIASKKGNDSKKISLRIIASYLYKSIAPTVREKVYLTGCVTFIVFAYVVKLIHPQTIDFYKYRLAFTFISIICLYWFAIVKLLRNIKQQKSSEEIIQEDIEKAKKEVLLEQKLVKELYKKVQKHTLEIVESKFKGLIEERQIRAKTSAILIPILVLVFVLILINILGIPIDFFGNKLLYGAVVGVPGIVAFIRPILEFSLESGLEWQIIRFKRCLSLLEQAQVLENNKVGNPSQQLDDPAFPEITYRRGASGQLLPVLRGTGLRVQSVVIAFQQWGLLPSQIADEYNLTEVQVNNALAFYAAHTLEIDTAIAAEQNLEAANV